MTQRVKTTAEVAVAFRLQFMKTLGSRLEPPICFPADVPNDLLCNFYDALPHSRKRGIWPEVAGQINKDEKWAAKHYLNSFRRALFPEPLSAQNKEDISNLVKKLMLKHYDKHSIVEEAKRKYQDTKIFPDAIQSYVFQTIVRLQRNQYELNSFKPANNDLFPKIKDYKDNTDMFKMLEPTISEQAAKDEEQKEPTQSDVKDSSAQDTEFQNQYQQLEQEQKAKDPELEEKYIEAKVKLDSIPADANDEERLKTLSVAFQLFSLGFASNNWQGQQAYNGGGFEELM
ncbi:Conserved_hypothetical protein [Hexamita inflata]|uniref:Uncharacterized protein n=1 Tax=Hexamita inflata TaxID=28002 RepID=A0AA86Q3I3_9EUKA|nr:Conserved hypothetical protein [Hexamita inflata]CAI9960453.1 Conserved hypothetical protein [Hexamita inflata]